MRTALTVLGVVIGTAFIDLMNDTIFYIFDTGAYEQSRNRNSGNNGRCIRQLKKYLLKASGILEGGEQYGMAETDTGTDEDDSDGARRDFFRHIGL